MKIILEDSTDKLDRLHFIHHKSLYFASHMHESYRELWLITRTTPFYVVIICVEIFFSHLQHKNYYTLKDTLENLWLMICNMSVDLGFRVVSFGVLTLCYNGTFVQINTPWIYWTVLVIGEDFLYYWLHYTDHYCRLFWAAHVTHHSCDKMNLTVGFRSTVFEPLYRFLFFIPLPFCGFKPLDIFFIYSVTQIWGILVHTEWIKTLGPLDWILTTPSHHRVHHASNPLYLDKNMGMLLIIWDRIFGTFQKELPASAYEPIKYGLTKNLENKNWFNLIFHEWMAMYKDVKGAPDLKSAWKYIFGPPGWSHDGSRLTSNQMRNAYYKQKQMR